MRGVKGVLTAKDHEQVHELKMAAGNRSGDPLTAEEIAALAALRHLAHDAHHCPHGRPTARLEGK